MTATSMVTYRSWNLGYGVPVKEAAYGEAEARRRFAAGETFWVLFGDPDRPELVMEVELGSEQINVVWLDELQREELSYLFVQLEERPAGELLLEQTHIQRYDHDERLPDAESSAAEGWYFKPDGTFGAFRDSPGTVGEQTEGRLEPDQFEVHREPQPAFGDWASITRP